MRFLSFLTPARRLAASGRDTDPSWAAVRSAGTFGTIPLVSGAGGVPRSTTLRMIYLTNPWVWASVNMLAQGLGRLPLHVYALDERGRKQRIRSDVPLTPGRPTAGQSLDTLLRVPTAGLSRNAMFAGTMRDRLVFGNALWEIQRPGGGIPTGIVRIPWQNVSRVIETRPLIADGYEIADPYTLKSRGLLAADVVHFGLGSQTDGALGVSPLAACRHTLALYEALVRHLLAYMKNGAAPSGYVQLPEGVTGKKAQEIRSLITDLYTAPENAGKIIAAVGKWTNIGDPPDQSQIVELVKLSREEIAAAFSVPPPVLGILDQAIKSNVKELREQYGRDSLGPLASDFEAEIQAQLLAPIYAWQGLFVEFQLAELLRPDLEARSQVYQRLASVYTIDEIRGFENMPPLDIPGVSDVPWAASGYLPIPAAAKKGAATLD